MVSKLLHGKSETFLILKYLKTLRALRSFLGMSGYYRCFIKDYASIAKPLTRYLGGENGNIGKNRSKKTILSLDTSALQAFDKIKHILASDDILLQYPDFDKTFDLTTDASSNGLGAVLSQTGRPITMISRALSKTEQNYATNELELLSIVWALKTLRNYLYGVKNINIFTDHQPLIFSISEKNPNTKLKRWKSFIEEFSPKFFYKPGKENVVADALSRQFINNISDSLSTIHSQISSSDNIKTLNYPVNQFKNQIMISESTDNIKTTELIFQKLKRHDIKYQNNTKLLDMLKLSVNPNVTNAIYCDAHTIATIGETLISNFPGVKFVHTEKYVIDVPNKVDQLELVTIEHNRAHRNMQENFKQLISEYYFPEMRKTLKNTVANCKICHENKYQREPPNPELGKTPIPTRPGEILHIDVFTTDKQHFLTCIDKFSKFAVVYPIASRSTLDIKNALLQMLNKFKNTNIIVSDNEKAFH